jgi:HD-like signal output (HDOD) protein
VREHIARFPSLAGLLHDIGKIIIVQFFQTGVQKAARLGQQKSLRQFMAEQKTFGVVLAEVGAWLGRKWNFRAPLNTIGIIQPDAAEEEFTDWSRCATPQFHLNLERTATARRGTHFLISGLSGPA